MPGYKGMKQDKKNPDLKMAGDVADGTAQKMAQDKKMMQPRKSGIYMDREDGKLPQSRVAQHYQDMDAKMEQYTGTNPVALRHQEEEKKKEEERKKKKEQDKANDTWYNDTAGDGNVISRGLKKLESYLPGPSGQGGNVKVGNT